MSSKILLFPLPGAILMPGANLPLHVYEPCYKQMVLDAKEQDLLITVTPLKRDGRNQDQYEEEIVTAGEMQIINDNEEEKTFDIILHGVKKVKLIKELSNSPYLTYSTKDITEDFELNEKAVEDLFFLRKRLDAWMADHIESDLEKLQIRKILEDQEKAISYLTLFLIGGVTNKKSILNANSHSHKIELIKQLLLPNKIDLGPYLSPIIKEY
jgi:Lon protease-like protein